MSIINVSVDVHGTNVQQKLDKLIDDATMLEIHNLLAKMCDPYVPYLEGHLSQTVEVYPDCVRYIQPYARRQYFGVDFNFTKDHHPQATAMWNQVMMSEHREEFVEGVKEILRRRIKDVYG